MEYNGGPYDRGTYGSSPESGEEGGRAPEASQRDDGYAQGYGQQPYSRSPYGQSPYGQSPYGQSAYDGVPYGTDYGEADASNSGPYSRDYAQSGYGREDARAPRNRADYARNDAGYEPDAGERGGYDRQGYAQQGYDRQGYDQQSYGYDQQGYDQQGYSRQQDYGRQGYDHQDYDQQQYDRQGSDGAYGNTDRMQRQQYGDDPRMSNTGRMQRPQYDDDPRMGGTGRMQRPQYDDDPLMSNTGRMRLQQDGYATYSSADAGADENTAAYDDDYEEALPERPKKKKKRSKFSRFMRGLGAYIAELPAKTLIIFGGSVAVLLVGIILLVMLLPKQAATPDIGDGQLALSDIPTPTPSLAPTSEPLPTDEILATPTPDPDPLNGVTLSKVGEENDILPSVQERLVALGYMEMPEGGYTTRFGPATKTAVRLFQIKNLTDYHDWDGILGAGTYNLLMSDTAKPFYLTRGDGDDRTKDITKLTDQVKKLQARLIVLGYLAAGSDTGRYGESTVVAVKTFQQFHGLDIDGQAGPSTLSLIYTDAAMDATTGAANDRSKITPTPAAPADATPDAAASTAQPATTNSAAPTPSVNENGVVVY